MKKTAAFISLFLLIFGLLSYSLASVVDTRHNLAHWSPYEYRATDESEVCKFCHTPHDASPQVPLWNHDLPTASFKKFSSATLRVDDDNTWGYDDPLAGATKLCLGCHDGLTSLGALRSEPVPLSMTVDTLAGSSSGYNNGGIIDISNKHPVSFVYSSTTENWLNTNKGADYGLPDNTDNNTITNTYVKDKWDQEGKRIECTICHDPHENRATNNRGQLPFWVSPAMGGYSSHDAVCISCHDPTFSEYTQIW